MGTRQMLQTLPDFHITLLGKEMAPTASARDLGVQVDATLKAHLHDIHFGHGTPKFWYAGQ